MAQLPSGPIGLDRIDPDPRIEGFMRAVALDIGGTKISSAIVELCSLQDAPSVGMIRKVSCNASEGAEHVLERIIELAYQTISDSQGNIDAIAIATTGTVRESDGSIAYYGDTIPGWTGTPLAARVKEELGIEAYVVNDLNAFALGEYWFGAGRGFDDILMVASGTGISAAVISSGNLMLGQNGYAGAFELTQQVSFSAGKHVYGSTKSIEEVSSGLGIAACYNELTGEEATGEEVSKLAISGERSACSVIETAGLALGQCIGHWANIFDPGAIIVGGSVFKAGELFDKALAYGFSQGASVLQRDTPILAAELGDASPLVGATIYAFKRSAEAC